MIVTFVIIFFLVCFIVLFAIPMFPIRSFQRLQCTFDNMCHEFGARIGCNSLASRNTVKWAIEWKEMLKLLRTRTSKWGATEIMHRWRSRAYLSILWHVQRLSGFFLSLLNDKRFLNAVFFLSFVLRLTIYNDVQSVWNRTWYWNGHAKNNNKRLVASKNEARLLWCQYDVDIFFV